MLLKSSIVIAFASIALFAAETRLKMKDLPEPVQKTVQEETKTAKLVGVSKEVEKGKTFYEAETTVDGKSRDLLIDPTGAIVEVEQEVTLESIPEAAQKAIKAGSGSGKIVKVESVTKGSVVSYEATIQKGGKKSEVAVNADGSKHKED